jgi:hypothetical protein
MQTAKKGKSCVQLLPFFNSDKKLRWPEKSWVRKLRWARSPPSTKVEVFTERATPLASQQRTCPAVTTMSLPPAVATMPQPSTQQPVVTTMPPAAAVMVMVPTTTPTEEVYFEVSDILPGWQHIFVLQHLPTVETTLYEGAMIKPIRQ